jgi:hypothetical protein
VKVSGPLPHENLLLRYTVEKLKKRDTYVTAIIVGTLINIYGQLLVPWLRGRGSPIDVFTRELSEAPILGSISIALGFIFPVFVGVYSSVATRWANRKYESRALFPDHKPDPVFRANFAGDIVEAGETTRELFKEHEVAKAPDVLGSGVWQALVDAARAGSSLATETRVYFPPADTWYLVGSSPAPGDNVNVYLTRVAGEGGQEASGGDG